MDETRAVSFRALKPACVAVVQLTRQASPVAGLRSALQELHRCLCDTSYLDSQLADYAFFPLSLLLQRSKDLPDNIIVLILKCLEILICRGWQAPVPAQATQELLYLLSAFLDRAIASPQESDLLPRTLTTIRTLLRVNGSGESLKTDAPDALLGHTLANCLTGLEGAQAPATETGFAQVIDLLLRLMPAVLARKLAPGTISSLTKIIRPQFERRRPKQVVGACLSALDQVITQASQLPSDRSQSEIAASERQKWLQDAAPHITASLVQIAPLRSHHTTLVTDSLANLCCTILSLHTVGLERCISQALDLLLAISSRRDSQYERIYDRLKAQLQGDVVLQNALAHRLRNLAESLSHLQIASDRPQAIAQIATALGLLLEEHYELSGLSSTIHERILAAVSASLRDQDLTIESMSTEEQLTPVGFEAPEHALERLSTPPKLAFLSRTTSKWWSSRDAAYLHSLKTWLLGFHQDFFERASSRGQVGALWLSSQVLEIVEKPQELPDHLDAEASLAVTPDLEDAAFVSALSVLNNPEADLESELLACQLIQLWTERRQHEVRAELVELLPELVQRLGSPQPSLRSAAYVCLLTVAHACGYKSLSGLCFDNSDYLLNAAVIRLNTFDVAPGLPQMLSALVQLGGSSIIAHMDDVVDSVVATLAHYHAYPRLVEALFGFLGSLVQYSDEARPPEKLQLPAAPAQEVSRARTVSQVLALVQKPPHERRSSPADHVTDVRDVGDPPQAAPIATSVRQGAEGNDSTTRQTRVLKQIMLLCQHYVSNEVASIRIQVLKIVQTGLAKLANDPDVLLPTINDLWPTVVSRLLDRDQYVSIAAMNAVSCIVQQAKGFMGTRIQDDWQTIRTVFDRLSSSMQRGQTLSDDSGTSAVFRRTREALAELLIAIQDFVEPVAEVEDQVYMMLGCLISPESKQTNLGTVDPDVVWLLRHDRTSSAPLPQCMGFEYRSLDGPGIGIASNDNQAA